MGQTEYVLDCGSNGSSIIITTRLKKVATIMGTIQMHELYSLSKDDWIIVRRDWEKIACLFLRKLEYTKGMCKHFAIWI